MAYVLKFTADWCGPCQKVKKFVETMSINYEIEVKEINIDDDENYELTKVYNVTNIPHFVFKNIKSKDLSTNSKDDIIVIGSDEQELETAFQKISIASKDKKLKKLKTNQIILPKLKEAEIKK